jgi:hypothetical protein
MSPVGSREKKPWKRFEGRPERRKKSPKKSQEEVDTESKQQDLEAMLAPKDEATVDQTKAVEEDKTRAKRIGEIIVHFNSLPACFSRYQQK